MPARQPFDERHLQDVVLAQSEQIRAARPRFSGLAILARPVTALAAVVAIVAIALGVKDYVGKQNADSPASTGIPTLEPTKAITHRKKITAGKTDRTRMSGTTDAETSQPAADETEKSFIGEPSVDAGTTGMTVMGSRPNPLTQTASEEPEAIDRDNGVQNEHDKISKPGSPTCLPLPNGTKPGDVDAPYYFGWATEYCGHDLSRPAASAKAPETPPSKR